MSTKTWAEICAGYEARDAVHQVGVKFLPGDMAEMTCSCGADLGVVHEDKYDARAYLHLGIVPENTEHLTLEWFRSPAKLG